MSQNAPVPVDEELLFWLSTDSNGKDKQRAYREEGELSCQVDSAHAIASMVCHAVEGVVDSMYHVVEGIVTTAASMCRVVEGIIDSMYRVVGGIVMTVASRCHVVEGIVMTIVEGRFISSNIRDPLTMFEACRIR